MSDVRVSVLAMIVVLVSGRLGFRTVQALLDAAPSGLEDRIRAAAESVEGIVDCHAVRVRYSGNQLFVDAHVLIDGRVTLDHAHHLTELVEEAIQRIAPGADVTVHAEPASVSATVPSS